jgi:hypothetical protein
VPHWNEEIPGVWSDLVPLVEMGSIFRRLQAETGVYRLVGLAEAGVNTPAIFNRMCGQDKTGTLYIGREGKNFAIRSRLSQLARSLREKPRRGLWNTEHSAGSRLRLHPTLSERFPVSKLAIAWCYDARHVYAERKLLDLYFWSFGDTPPLNRK